jgi:hypothetical protein
LQPDLATSRKKLDAFLVDNPELETLHARLAAFNVFRVLGIEHMEIRHSRVLAWLFDPAGAHGFGPTFLRRFISRMLMAKQDMPLSLSPARVELSRSKQIRWMVPRDREQGSGR